MGLINTYFTTAAVQLALSAVAVVISCLSVWFTRTLWVRSNRPIGSAMVQTHSGGNHSIAYNLAVINSGNRPAVTVRLKALNQHVEDAMAPSALTDPRLASFVREAHRCFSAQGIIPLLLNGQTVTNGFGITGNQGHGGPLWQIDASIPVAIHYSDLDGRKFQSNVTLLVKDSAGFAGSYWHDPHNG